MPYRRFEDLPVWNAAADLAIRVFEVSKAGRLGHYSGLRDQIERAALSISNNIAEGFERGTTAELISFLFIARGSAGEVRSMLIILERIHHDEAAAFADLKTQATDISRQLGAWIASLQNATLQGPRTLTQQQKAERAAAERRENYLQKLRDIQNGGDRNSDDREG